METVEQRFQTPGPQLPPWALPDERLVSVETGRQALALLAERLRRPEGGTVLAPGYLCDSMIEPFISHGWTVEAYAMTGQLSVDHHDVRARARALSRTTRGPVVALLALYFGSEPDDDYRALVADLQAQDLVVIDDETHRVFRAGGAGADYSIASLRKTLPLADGAYVRGGAADDIREPLAAYAEHPRWTAMDDKRRQLDGEPDTVDPRSAFAAANHELEKSDIPRAISTRSLTAIEVLDYASMERARLENAGVLTTLMGDIGIPVLNPPGPRLVPSHLVIRVKDAGAVQAAAARAGVYCPIHWPPSELLEGGTDWPSDVLSLPVDHRYDSGDMRRIASVIEAALA
ncbi:hypothetical protein ACFVWR_00345 [Leifsonia sp. NPDC058292]|uniref:hypothetical protein n=1 Tax=Leifsonia sp. NPDC058292 TaxID=3346428 RepID=UPI0036DC3243